VCVCGVGKRKSVKGGDGEEGKEGRMDSRKEEEEGAKERGRVRVCSVLHASHLNNDKR
jgi:hypothetical protein